MRYSTAKKAMSHTVVAHKSSLDDLFSIYTFRQNASLAAQPLGNP
jgi:hypothetical protein